MNRLKRIEPFFLFTLPLAPFLFVALLSSLRTGRDLTGVFLVGVVLFLAGAILLIVIGFWQRRAGWKNSGVAVFISLIVVFLYSGTGIWWIGVKSIAVTVIVRDESTQQPIPNAAVRLFKDSEMEDANKSECQTDEKGTCFLNHRFTSIGTLSPIRDTGSYYLWRDTLKVDATNFHSISKNLETFTGPGWPLHGPPMPAVEVRLKKNSGPQNPVEANVGLVAGSVSFEKHIANYRTIKVDLKAITAQVQAYQSDHLGKIPPTLETLLEKDTDGKGPYVVGIKGIMANNPLDGHLYLRDPWGHPYQYDPSGDKNFKLGGAKALVPDIFTVTPDHQLLGNWQQ